MGERVKKFLEYLRLWCREERGRQQRLSEETGISKQTISHWLNDRQEPTAEQLLAVLEFLDGKK